jgi:hypothetical protein
MFTVWAVTPLLAGEAQIEQSPLIVCPAKAFLSPRAISYGVSRDGDGNSDGYI